jgi:hypothetical protein
MFNHLKKTHLYEKGNLEIYHPDGHSYPNGHRNKSGRGQLHGPTVDTKRRESDQ